jgi:hypothetical protein
MESRILGIMNLPKDELFPKSPDQVSTESLGGKLGYLFPWKQLIFVILDSSTVCGSPHVIFNFERTTESGLATMRLWVRILFIEMVYSTPSCLNLPHPPNVSPLRVLFIAS